MLDELNWCGLVTKAATCEILLMIQKEKTLTVEDEDRDGNQKTLSLKLRLWKIIQIMNISCRVWGVINACNCLRLSIERKVTKLLLNIATLNHFHEFYFTSIFEIYPKIGSYRLATHRRGAHRKIFLIPSYFRIEIQIKCPL